MTKNKFFAILLLALPLMMVSCDDGDDHYYGHPEWGNNNQGNRPSDGGLNDYERQLVGSYVSDDDPDNPFYLILNDDRTGAYRSVNNGVTSGEGFTWSATRQNLTVNYDSGGDAVAMEYYYENNHLYVDGIPLVLYNGSLPEIGGEEIVQTPLVGQWQGAIDGYYSAVWGLEDGEYQTVCEFMSNGSGCQLDYDIYEPKVNYAYTPFTWAQVNDVITITYQADSDLSAARISNYALTSKEFTGTFAYGEKDFRFKFSSVTGFNWEIYQSDAKARRQLRAARKAPTGIVRKGTFVRSSF